VNDSLDVILQQIHQEIQSLGLDQSGIRYDVESSHEHGDDDREDLYTIENSWRR
jgi:hypothetical protein